MIHLKQLKKITKMKHKDKKVKPIVAWALVSKDNQDMFFEMHTSKSEAELVRDSFGNKLKINWKIVKVKITQI